MTLIQERPYSKFNNDITPKVTFTGNCDQFGTILWFPKN